MIQTVNRKNVNTGEIENYGAEFDISWLLNSHWSLSTNHAFLHMKNPVVAAPTYKGLLQAKYHQRKWSVIAGLQYINGLYTAVGDNETKENFCLLNASVSYILCQNISLWLRGENLLSQKYEINLGYPMPGTTFMVGVFLNLT